MAVKQIPCGGFYYDDTHISFEGTKDKPILRVLGGGDGQIDHTQYLKKTGDSMNGNLDMNGNTINDVDIISNQVSVTTTDKQSAIHIRMNDTTKELSICRESQDTGEILPLGILNVDTPTKDSHAVNKKYADENYGSIKNGISQKDIDMNNHSITKAERISTNGSVPVFLGNTIEQNPNGVRYGANLDGSGAILKPNTQSEYAPLYIGEPTDVKHSATKDYVDKQIKSLSNRLDAMATNLNLAQENIKELTQYKIKYEQLMKVIAGEV